MGLPICPLIVNTGYAATKTQGSYLWLQIPEYVN